MPDETSDGEAGTGGGSSSPTRGRSRRKTWRFVLVGIVIVAAILIGYAGSAPEPDRTPSSVLDGAGSLLGREIRVRGTVSAWDQENMTFFVSDNQSTLAATYSVQPPHQMEVDKEVMVVGVLRKSADGYYIDVGEVIVGHPG